ncbi:MAG TPA: tryptophan synthase subunit alpha [Anaerolineae bacterium]|nr:tryptophan synthase subunit alpha [Anaerolineae bacterium]HIP71487.1 tryptophan synthase subunit alpha [Anaerolineae bacterium]
MSETRYGRDHITAAFQNAQQSQTAALMPYFTLGYPDRQTSLDIITAIAPHSDLLELGLPFSDPLADGPTIQRSTQIALENGTTTAVCLEMVRELRQRGVTAPIMLMGYYNPALAYGQVRYVSDALAAGADGFIIPDLPPEEAGELEMLVNEAGMALIYFLAPTSNEARIQLVTQRARGFIYLVSVTGVTGARQSIQPDLSAFVQRVRQETNIPLAVGFGIGTPQQAAQIGQLADGVIVGSALINAADSPQAAADFTRSLREALRNA